MWNTCAFLEYYHGRDEIHVTDHGVVRVLLVKANANTKALTVEVSYLYSVYSHESVEVASHASVELASHASAEEGSFTSVELALVRLRHFTHTP